MKLAHMQAVVDSRIYASSPGSPVYRSQGLAIFLPRNTQMTQDELAQYSQLSSNLNGRNKWRDLVNLLVNGDVGAYKPSGSLINKSISTDGSSHRTVKAKLPSTFSSRHADIGLADTTPAAAPPSSAAWSDLSVRRAGSSQVLSSAQASRLLALVQAVVHSAVPGGDRDPPGTVRFELTRRGELVATLDLADRWLRWTPVGADSRGALVARVSAAQWEAIQNELTRLGLRAP